MAMRLKPTPAVMVGAMILSVVMVAIIGPHFLKLYRARVGCTEPVTGTIEEWVPAENGRRLEAVASFSYRGEVKRVTLAEVNRKTSSPPETGESVSLKVNPSSGHAVLGSAFRALGVWVGLLMVAVLMFAGALWALLFAKRKPDGTL